MTMFNKVSKTFKFGDHDVTLTTGEIARQATGAVICQMDDTVVLATVVAKKETKPGQDFFPLTVDYIEKAYAAGLKRISGQQELESIIVNQFGKLSEQIEDIETLYDVYETERL